MNDKDSKLIYEGWRGMISKKWDQNHGSRERGFADHEAEQQHLDAEAADKAAAEKYGLDVEDYLKVKAHSEYSGESIEALLRQRQADQEKQDAESLEASGRAKAARHERRERSGYYKDNNRVPMKDENGHWIDGGVSRQEYEYRKTGDQKYNAANPINWD